MKLETRFAQEICDNISTQIGLTVSFMGEEGMIFASSARDRIGSRHEVAARVMAGEIDHLDVDKAAAARAEQASTEIQGVAETGTDLARASERLRAQLDATLRTLKAEKPPAAEGAK